MAARSPLALATAALAGLAVFAAASPGPAEEPPSPDALEALNQAVMQDRILPGNQAVAEAAGGLAAALETHCAGPDAASLEGARAAFHAVYDRWMAVAWIGFGPQVQLMRSMRVHFWPDGSNTLTRQLARLLDTPREDLLDPAVLGDASVALQGLPVLERMLFADPPPVAEVGYACDLAVAIAGNVQSMATDIAGAWADPGRRLQALPEGAMLTASLYQSVYEHLVLIGERKLMPVLGDAPADARPRLAENWRSARAMANIAANLTAVLGVVENGEGLGFADLLRDRPDQEVADQAAATTKLVDALETALSIAQDLQGRPMADLVAETASYDALANLVEAVAVAREIWARDVGAALGLTIGFNRLDGD